MIACPLCKSEDITLTDFEKVTMPDVIQHQARIYCNNCSKAMTVCGLLYTTAAEVTG